MPYYKYKVTNTDGEVECDSFRRVDPYDEPEFSGFELRVELNAVLDGVFGTFNSVTNGLLYAFARYEDVDVINGENVLIPSGGDQFSHIAKYKAYPVPFRCTVHKPAFYELGQTVVFPDHENTFDNYRYGYAEHVPYIRSVITEIEWTFRGGTKLACGEGESLSMMTLAVESKANSVRRELRSRTEAKEIWAGTSSGFESIEHEPKKLYAVVDEMQQTRSRSSAVSYDSKLYIGDVQIGGDLWSGTTYEYEQLDNYDANRLYLTVDGRGQATTAKLYAGSVQICDSELFSRVTALETAVTTLQSSVTALQAAVTALQNTVVTSAEIRTINVVQDMPGSPISTVLYVVDGGAE